MSQPNDFLPGFDPLGSPIKSLDQLIEPFLEAERPKEQWLLGIEYEMFAQSKGPLPYEGAISITSLFNHLIKKNQKADGFLPIMEGKNIVGLTSESTIIALEPGGQIEVALKPYGLTDTIQKFSQVVKELVDGAHDLGIKLFALGVHPLAKRDEMAVVKKERYGIMRPYMGGLSGLGMDMMTRTAAIQINLDFKNEADMAQKTKKAAILVPMYALLCSSVAFIEGKPTTQALMRSYFWLKTDSARTGIPKIIFDKNFGYSSWINLALDVPMYFIRRGNSYHNVAGASFRDFIKNGLLNEQATVRDFVDHLSTVFTEVRLKPILEIRSPDSLPVPFVNALTALSFALFYNEKANQKSDELLSDISYDELMALRNEIIHDGRKAKFRGEHIYKLISSLLNIADTALSDQEKALLKPFKDLIEKNTTVAEWIKAHFDHLDEQNLPKLIDHFSPFKTL